MEKTFPHFINSLLKAEGGTNSVNRKCNPLRRSCVSSARNAGESAICRLRAQPSAEIVRVECAKCRRECDLPAARATLCGDRACRVREMQARAPRAGCARNPLRRSCVSSARNAGESAARRLRAQPSAEIARVECAKCRRERELPAARANLCGARETQARVRFSGCARNPLRRSCASSARNAGESAARRLRAQPSAERSCVSSARNAGESSARRVPAQALRRSCVSSARNAGESAIREITAQPSAEIVRVECAKRRPERDLRNYRATLCGDRARRVREMQARVRCVKIPRDPLRRSCVPSARNAAEQAVEVEAENWRLCSATLVRGVAGELEAENWRRGRTTVVRGVAGEWEDENWRVGTRSSWGAGS